MPVTIPMLLAFPERHPGKTIAFIGFMFALAYGASLVLLAKPNGQIVIGDALEHYVQLRSAAFDRDLQFVNDYAGLYRLDEAWVREHAAYKMTATGHMRNYMPVGPALLWAPAFLLVTACVWLINALGFAYPLDGFARAFQASAGFTGIIAATAGSWLAYRAAAGLFDVRVAIWATLTVWLSSSALYYSVISPAYSHAASMLAVSAFWLLWIRTGDRQDVPRYFWCGVLVGVSALMRWQDAVLIAIPALDALWHRRDGGARMLAARISASGAGAAFAFVPQMIVWAVLFGAPLTIPQGPGFMKWSEPAALAVLFSDNHGLLTWTPVLAFALAGLVLLVRRAPRACAAALLFFAAAWYVNAAVADWWAGEAFGARRFVSCYPIFVIGLAAFFNRLRHPGWIAGFASAFIVYTLLLLVQYQAYMHRLLPDVPYPRGFADLWLARFRVPFELVAAWLGRGHG
jgi:hypothetical protein